MFAAVLLFLSIFACAQAVQFADRLRPFVDEVDGHLAANFRNVSEAVLLVGAPGTGKTALAMLLAEDASLRLERSTAGVILADSGRKIGRSTFLPNFMRDDHLGTVLVDCPSPVEPEEAVVAAEYAILRTVAILSKVKVIVVENTFSLMEGGDREGKRRLKEFVKRFAPVSAVVASKGDSNDNFIDSVSGAEYNAPLINFPRPFRPGSPLETLSATTSSVRKALVDSKWTTIKPTQSPQTICFLKTMLDETVKETITEFNSLLNEVQSVSLKTVADATDHLNAASLHIEKISQLNASNYSALVAELKSLGVSSERIDFLSVQLDWLRGLGMDVMLDMGGKLNQVTAEAFKIKLFYEFVQDINTALKGFKFLKERDELRDILKEQSFDNLLISMAAFDIKPRQQLLGLNLTDWMKKDLDEALNKKLGYKDWSNEKVVVAASFILLSEVSEKVSGWNTSVVLMASQVIYLDQDFELDDSRDLTLIAPEVQIVKENLTLTLKGRKGSAPEGVAANEDGKAGAPGGPAGNLIIICTRIVGAENLLVMSVGGEGGAGHQGAPAAQGKLQPEETLEFLESSSHNNTVGNRTNGTIRVAYREGRSAPKKAGHGGVGGEGGHPGSVLIHKKDGEAKEVRVEAQRGKTGAPGLGGAGAPEDFKFVFTIADCQDEQCVQIATGRSVDMVPAVAEGEGGKSTLGLEGAIQPLPLTLRRYMYLYVGTVLSKDLSADEEREVVGLVERLPSIVRERGGDFEGELRQIEAEWALMEREKAEMKKALGRHLPLMHRILLAYADHVPGGRRLSELIRSTQLD